MLSQETALALICSCGLSQDDYQIRFVTCQKLTMQTYSPLTIKKKQKKTKKMLKAKKDCLPKNIEVRELIWHLYNILCLVNSNYVFDLHQFKIYLKFDATYDLYVNEYPLFYMPVTMHKLLVHSSKIIPNFELPIVYYTEEAQEARNKDNKAIRLFHTRKMNRLINMTDQFSKIADIRIIFI